MNDNSFEGGVLAPGGTRQTAQLHLSVDGLRAQLADGSQQVAKWHTLSLAKGGSAGTTVFASAGKLVFDCDHPDFLRAVEGTGGNDIADQLAALAGQRVASRRGHRLAWIAVIVVLGVGIWGVPKAFRAGVNGVVERLPYSVDETIGEAANDSMETPGKVIEDPSIVEPVQEILDRLAAKSDFPDLELHLTVVENEISNAFALPGGYITVFTGLLSEATSPEMVAGVLAHEISHVTRRHGLRRVAHSIGLIVGLQLLIGDTSGLSRAALELFTMSRVNGYSREQESQADSDAVRLLIDADIDPLGLADFFRLLQDQGGSVPSAMAWISTHPEHGVRIEAIEQAAKDLGALGREFEPFELDWETLQESLGEQ